MSTLLKSHLEAAWSKLHESLADVERNKQITVIQNTYKKVASLKALPTDSEDIAKLVMGMLLAEAIEEKITIPIEKQKMALDAVRSSLKEHDNLINNKGKNNSKTGALIKATLGIAAAAAALWFSGPYCALIARNIFSAGYLSLYGQPGWVTHYSYFVPAQEWVGNIAFSYGPTVLSVPAGTLGALAVDTTSAVLSRSQKILSFAFRYHFKKNKRAHHGEIAQSAFLKLNV